MGRRTRVAFLIVIGLIASSSVNSVNARGIGVTDRQLIVGVEGPSLWVENQIPDVTARSLAALKAFHSTQEALTSAVRSGPALGTVNLPAAVAAIDEASKIMEAMSSTEAETRDSLEEALANVSVLDSISSDRSTDLALESMTAASSHVSDAADIRRDIVARLARARAALTTLSVGTVPDPVSGIPLPTVPPVLPGEEVSLIEVSELLVAADADLSTLAPIWEETERALTKALKHRYNLGYLPSLAAEPQGAAALDSAAEEILDGLGDAASLQRFSPAANSYAELASAHVEAALEPPSPEARDEAEYSRSLDAAATSLTTLTNDFEGMESVLGEMRARLEGASTVLDLYQGGVSADTSVLRVAAAQGLPPEVIALRDSVFAALDSVTDTEVLAADVGPGVRETLNGIIAQVNLLTPPAVMVPSQAMIVLNTVEASQSSVRASLNGVAGTVESLVATLDGSIPLGKNDCSSFSEHGITYWFGTPGADSCTGSGSIDIFYTRGGSDIVYAHGAADDVHLGGGADIAHGHSGADHEFGGDGSDTVFGGPGNDVIEDKKVDTHDRDLVFGGGGTDEGTIHDEDLSDCWRGGGGTDPEPDFDWHANYDSEGNIESIETDDVRRDSASC